MSYDLLFSEFRIVWLAAHVVTGYKTVCELWPCLEGGGKEKWFVHCTKTRTVKPFSCNCVGLSSKVCEAPTAHMGFWPCKIPSLKHGPWWFPEVMCLARARLSSYNWLTVCLGCVAEMGGFYSSNLIMVGLRNRCGSREGMRNNYLQKMTQRVQILRMKNLEKQPELLAVYKGWHHTLFHRTPTVILLRIFCLFPYCWNKGLFQTYKEITISYSVAFFSSSTFIIIFIKKLLLLSAK